MLPRTKSFASRSAKYDRSIFLLSVVIKASECCRRTSSIFCFIEGFIENVDDLGDRILGGMPFTIGDTNVNVPVGFEFATSGKLTMTANQSRTLFHD